MIKSGWVLQVTGFPEGPGVSQREGREKRKEGKEGVRPGCKAFHLGKCRTVSN